MAAEDRSAGAEDRSAGRDAAATGELPRVRVGTQEVQRNLRPHPEVLEEEEMTPAGAYPVGEAMTGGLVNDDAPSGSGTDGDITG